MARVSERFINSSASGGLFAGQRVITSAIMNQIPDKLYFKIGEVSRVTRIKPYILRYWESEFNIISPDKSRGNQRIYKRFFSWIFESSDASIDLQDAFITLETIFPFVSFNLC